MLGKEINISNLIYFSKHNDNSNQTRKDATLTIYITSI